MLESQLIELPPEIFREILDIQRSRGQRPRLHTRMIGMFVQFTSAMLVRIVAEIRGDRVSIGSKVQVAAFHGQPAERRVYEIDLKLQDRESLVLFGGQRCL